MPHKPPDWVIARWSGRWQHRFTPTMKAIFRKLARGSRQRRHIPPATLAALRRQSVIMESYYDTWYVSLNANGCDLLDWLRYTKQVTKDREAPNALRR